MDGRSRWGGYLAALLLMALTLSVFAALRDYGPESALRRFHQAALDGDARMLQSVCKDNIESPVVQRLVQHVQALGQAGARVRMGRVDRETRVDNSKGVITNVPSVITEVRYFPPGRVESIYWVLDHDPGGWVVNATETAGFPSRFGITPNGLN